MSGNDNQAVVVKDYAQEEASTPAVAKEGEYPPPSPAPDIYDRFSKRRKAFILTIVSYNAFLSPMTASIILPSVPAIAHDLDTTATIINVTIALFIITIGTAPLLWSPLSGFYGRRPIYLASAPVMLVSSIGVAFSRTVPQLIVTRILQGIGSSSVLSVGAGSIGDIYRPTERSNAMSWFYTGALLGPSVSPVLGAALTEYTAQTWRSTQFFLVGCSALSVILTYFFLPETMHPPTAHQKLCEQRGKRFVPFVFNPLAILGLFAWPNISCITFISSCCMLMTYVIIIPITSAFSDQYGIDNIFVLGCFYLATGGGNIIGSRIIGPYADATVKKYIAKRGHRRPEDRLRAAVFGLGLVLPLSCLAYGWLIQTRKGGVAPPVVFMVIQGAGLMFTLAPLNTYAVDSMQDRSAEVIAVNNWVRYLFAAAASAFVLPMANAIGWGLTMTIASIIVWISFAILLLVIRYGHLWREAANHKHGYNVQAEDEKHGPEPGTVSTSDAGAEAEAAHDTHEDEHHDEPGELPLPAVQRAASQKVIRPSGAAGPATRQRSASRASRDGMPDVHEVLQRTTSLSGASVHGGG